MKWVFLLVVSAQGFGYSAELPQAITRAGNAVNVAGAGHSLQPTITPDGRYVVFLSHANNLVLNDDLGPGLDVFVRDLQSAATMMVSVNRFGTGGGQRDSGYASISPDGRFIVFSSDANNLVANDTNEASDVFMRDIATGTTLLVSANTNGGVSRSTFGSTRPIMSPDGRWIVFESSAEDLVEGDANNIRDLFIRDTQSSAMRLVRAGTAFGGRSHSASVTDDGRRVAFVSTAANVIAGRTNRNGDVYVRDLQTSTTLWVSSNLVTYFHNGPEGFRCFNPVISSNGQHVAFKAASLNIPVVFVFYHDLQAGTTEVIADNSHPNTLPGLSADGRWLAFERNDAIYLRDTETGTNLLVSVNALGSGPANGKSLRPVLTPDAAHVAFISSATDLVTITPAGLTNVSRIYVRDVVAGVTRLVGVATNSLPGGSDMEGTFPAISANGQLVAFDTDASDIVADDRNHAYDVFVRNLAADSTELISVRHASRPARTGLQSAGISRLSVSADAERIAFTSYDDGRVPHDTNRMIDAFVLDRLTNELLPQSDSNGVFNQWVNAVEPSISGNGQYLVFLREKRSGSLYSGNTFDIVWRSVDGGAQFPLRTNVSFFVNAAASAIGAISFDGSMVAYGDSTYPNGLSWTNMIAGTGGAVDRTYPGFDAHDPNSRNPVFSSNGQLIAFVSGAPNLTSNSISGIQMYVRDLSRTNSTRVLSVDTNGAPLPNARTTAGIFSGNDRYVVFDGAYGPSQQWRIYRYDLDTGVNRPVCTGCRNPSISYDGQVIAYNETWGGFSTTSNIYVMNLTTGMGQTVSRDYAGNGISNNHFSPPLLSANGRYVVFESTLGNLVALDTNRFNDVFVHDRVQGTTALISRSRFGPRSAAGISSKPVMSADGRTVVFQSFADDLVEGDYNERRDIFLLRLGVGDSDNDGMDDDWEVAHFDNLDRDGAGDFDGDGVTDRQEFVSGTDPTNEGSVLRVLTVSPMGGGSTTVMWSAVPNRNYVVQFKDSLNTANWSNASGVLTASSNSEAFLHPSSAAQRYYRVIAVQ